MGWFPEIKERKFGDYMRILFDHQIFEMQNIGGISRYFTELILGIPDNKISLGITKNLYIHTVPWLSQTLSMKDPNYESFILKNDFKGKRKLYKIYNKITKRDEDINHRLSVDALKAAEFDIFHPTYYDPYFLEYVDNKPFVLTVFDMIHEKFPELFPLEEALRRNKKELALKASKIIAISEYTKKDIIDIYGIQEDRIDVVYLGSSLSMKQARSNKDGFPPRYILYTGARHGYKNFYFMLNALVSLFSSTDDLYIVCTGPEFSENEIKYINSLGISSKVIHCFAKDDELFSLYKNALCFIFPSYYEGFGIPILEAFEAGCPVILADSSCFREIAIDAAVYFPPKSVSGLQDAVRLLLNDDSVRNQLVAAGYNRGKEFSWDRTVRETLAVYESVL